MLLDRLEEGSDWSSDCNSNSESRLDENLTILRGRSPLKRFTWQQEDGCLTPSHGASISELPEDDAQLDQEYLELRLPSSQTDVNTINDFTRVSYNVPTEVQASVSSARTQFVNYTAYNDGSAIFNPSPNPSSDVALQKRPNSVVQSLDEGHLRSLEERVKAKNENYLWRPKSVSVEAQTDYFETRETQTQPNNRLKGAFVTYSVVAESAESSPLDAGYEHNTATSTPSHDACHEENIAASSPHSPLSALPIKSPAVPIKRVVSRQSPVLRQAPQPTKELDSESQTALRIAAVSTSPSDNGVWDDCNQENETSLVLESLGTQFLTKRDNNDDIFSAIVFPQGSNRGTRPSSPKTSHLLGELPDGSDAVVMKRKAPPRKVREPKVATTTLSNAPRRWDGRCSTIKRTTFSTSLKTMSLAELGTPAPGVMLSNSSTGSRRSSRIRVPACRWWLSEAPVYEGEQLVGVRKWSMGAVPKRDKNLMSALAGEKWYEVTQDKKKKKYPRIKFSETKTDQKILPPIVEGDEASDDLEITADTTESLKGLELSNSYEIHRGTTKLELFKPGILAAMRYEGPGVTCVAVRLERGVTYSDRTEDSLQRIHMASGEAVMRGRRSHRAEVRGGDVKSDAATVERSLLQGCGAVIAPDFTYSMTAGLDSETMMYITIVGGTAK